MFQVTVCELVSVKVDRGGRPGEVPVSLNASSALIVERNEGWKDVSCRTFLLRLHLLHAVHICKPVLLKLAM